MSLKVKRFMKTMSFSFASSASSFIVSVIVAVIIPKLIGVEEYGFWQLYLFYSSYVGFMHFGWLDGIYLRFGGEEYKNLDKRLFHSQFIELLMLQALIGILIWLSAALFIEQPDRGYIIKMIAISLVLMNTRYMLIFTLQATNRIKEYAFLTILDRTIYIIIVLFLIFVGENDYRLMIYADLIGVFISLVYASYACREIVFMRFGTFYFSIREVFTNINVGIKLLFANIISMLIVGIVRFGIERTWGVAVFGKVSLTLSISNMMMVFINAIGIIIYPVLRKASQEELTRTYALLRDSLMAILLGVMLLYYPLKTMMMLWLPYYADSLLYMALLFPLVIYEGKTTLLLNTYLKAMRKEKVILRMNLITMALSLVMTFIAIMVFYSLEITIAMIVLMLAIRSILAEIYLGKEIKVHVNKDICLEMTLSFVFIITAWFLNTWMVVWIYGITYMIYLSIKKKDLVAAIQNIKRLAKG